MSWTESGEREERLNRLIADYYLALERGETLDRAALLAANPEFATDLEKFFSSVGEFESAAGSGLEGEETVLVTKPAANVPRPGDHVRYFGDYEVLEEIGSGGMGLVFKVRQSRLKRIVALKMIRSGAFASDEEVRRFQAEARAAAKLEHPNITAVHEVGACDGRHYFTMDFLAGGTLADLVRRETVTPVRAATLMVAMAKAIHYAHQCGVLHRDLKPGNILLTSGGEPRVSDFGLAKRLFVGEGDSDLAPPTETGQVIGTAGYMSPEQATGKSRLVGPAADIYGLGAVLYALLTTRAPFVGESQAATLLQVMHQDPLPPRMLNPNVPRDLETITLKCLRKEPHERYGTAELLAQDLERFLDGRPILARRVGVVERGFKWCRRNPVIAGLTAAVAASLLIGIGVSLRYAGIARDTKIALLSTEVDAQTSKKLADEKAKAAKDAELRAEQNRVDAERNRLKAEQEERESQRQAYLSGLTLMWQAHESGEWGKLSRLLAATSPESGKLDPRGWEWRYLQAQVEQTSRLLDPRKFRRNIDYCPATDELVVDIDHWFEIWNVSEGKKLRSFRQPTLGDKVQFAWSPDGKYLAYSQWESGAVVIDAQDGRMVLDARHSSRVTSVAWSADGRRLAIGSRIPASFELFDTADWRRLPTPERLAGTPIWALGFQPQSSLLAIGGDKEVLLWDTSGTDVVRQSRPAGGFAWSPAGDRLLASWYGQITLGTPDGLVLQTISPVDGLAAVRWLDDTRFVVTDKEAGVVLWDARTGEKLAVRKPHEAPVEELVVSRRPGELVSLDTNGEIRVWNILRKPEPARRLHVSAHALADLQWSESGRGWWLAEHGGRVSQWNAANGEQRAVFRLESPQAVTAVREYGGRLFCAHAKGPLTTFDTKTGAKAAVKSLEPRGGLSLTPDGKHLGCVETKLGGGPAVIVDTDRFAEVWRGARNDSLQFAFSPRGDRFAYSSFGGLGVRAFPVEDTERAWASRDGVQINGLAWRPDGEQLAEATDTGQVIVYRAADLLKLKTIEAHRGSAVAVQWSNDQKRFTTAGKDGTVVLWDADTFTRLGELRSPEKTELRSLAWSPDDRHLAATASDGTVLTWSSEPLIAAVGKSDRHLAGARSSVLPEVELIEVDSRKIHEGAVTAAAFTPYGQIATVGADKHLRITDFQRPQSKPLLSLPAGDDKAHEQLVKFVRGGAGMLLGRHGNPGKLQFWNWRQRELIWEQDWSASYAAVSPDNELLVLASWESPEIRVIELATGREITTLSGVEPDSATPKWLTSTVAFAPDGRTFVSLCGGTEDTSAPSSWLRVWDRKTFECLQETSLGVERYYGLAFTPAGDRLVVGGTGGRLAVLQVTPPGPPVDKETLIATFEETRSPDPDVRLPALRKMRELGPQVGLTARRIAGRPSAEITIALRRATEGADHQVFPTISETVARLGTVMGVAITGDGKYIAAAARVHQKNQGEITVAATDRLQSPLFRWTGPSALCVAFSPDDRYLVAGLEDGSVRVWEVCRGADRPPHPELAALTAAIARAPHSSEAWLARGEFHQRRQDWRLALADFTESFRIDSRNFRGAMYASAACLSLGDHGGHREWSQKLLAPVEANEELGELDKFYIVQGICQGREFLPDYSRLANMAAKIGETSPHSHLQRVHLYGLLRTRQWERAIAFAEKFEAQKFSGRELATAAAVQAIAHRNLGQSAEAEAALQQAERHYQAVSRSPGKLLSKWDALAFVESLAVVDEARELLGRVPPPPTPTRDVTTPRPISLLTALEGQKGFVHYIRVVDQGATALTGGRDGRVLRWNLAGGFAEELSREGQIITALAVAPETNTLYVGLEKGGVQALNWKTLHSSQRIAGIGKYVHGLGWLPEQRILFAASEDVKQWSLGGSDLRATQFSAAGAMRVAPVSEELILVGGMDQKLHFLDLKGKDRFPPQPTGGIIHALAVSPDQRLAVTCGGKRYEDGEEPGLVTVWDLATGRRVRDLHGHRGMANDAVFSADGKLIVTGGRCDRTVRVWQTATGLELARGTARTRSTNFVAVTPDNRLILTGGGQYKSATEWTNDSEFRLFVWELPDLSAK